jgi:Tfp pilus assembly protein PilN
METIGLSIEAGRLKLAYIKRQGGRIKILSLESEQLPEPIDGRKNTLLSVKNTDGKNSEDAFGFQEPAQTSIRTPLQSDRITNSDVILSVVKKYPLHSAKICITLPEGATDYRVFVNSDGLKGRRLQEQLAYELSSDTDTAEPHYIQIDEKSYLLPSTAAVSDSISPLLTYLQEIKSLLGRRVTISCVIPPEVALAFVARNRTVSSDSSIVIYVGEDFARIIFLKQGTMYRVSSVITFEHGNEDFVSIINARLLFELDQSGNQPPEEILLCGVGCNDRILRYFQSANPDSICAVITDDARFDTSLMEEKQAYDMTDYAVALGAAIAGFLGIHPSGENGDKVYEHSNFLPKQVRQEQSSFRLAWHGYIALALIFGCSLFFTIERITLGIQKKQSEFQLTLIADALKAERAIQQEIVRMEERTKHYTTALMLIDSLRSTTPSYSAFLKFFSDETNLLNSIWVTHLSAEKTAFRISGESVYRSRIHQLADAAENSSIQKMAEEKVRELAVYSFDITGSMERWNFSKLYNPAADTVVSNQLKQNSIVSVRR